MRHCVLALLEKYLPDAEVRLWASQDLSEEVLAMEHWRGATNFRFDHLDSRQSFDQDWHGDAIDTGE